MVRHPKSRKTYAGETIGHMHVLKEYDYFDKYGREHREYDCYCDACGETVIKEHRVLTIAKSHMVAEGKTPSCGCQKYSGIRQHTQSSLQDLTGLRYGKLVVVGQGVTINVGVDNKKRRTWKCLCDCGRATFVTTGDLVAGNTKSCGCLISVWENRIADWLTAHNIEFVREFKFVDLKTDNDCMLRFDFAIVRNQKLQCLIEYQGIQHFTTYNTWFGRLEREITDAQKRDYCVANHIPLFEIRYDDDIEASLERIVSQLPHDNAVPSSHEEKV